MDRRKHCVYLIIAILKEIYLIHIWLVLVILLWRLLNTRLCIQANWPSLEKVGYMQDSSEAAMNPRNVRRKEARLILPLART